MKHFILAVGLALWGGGIYAWSYVEIYFCRTRRHEILANLIIGVIGVIIYFVIARLLIE